MDYKKTYLTLASSSIVLAFVFININNGNLKIFMNGELSIKHSLLEYQCTSCHKPWKGVSDQSCIECHEQTTHSHFIEKDFSDVPDHPVKKVTCLHCHKEHKGITHNLKVVDNPKCLKCHPPDFMLGRKFKVID